MGFFAQWPIQDKPPSYAQVCYKGTNEQMHHRNTEIGQDSYLEHMVESQRQ